MITTELTKALGIQHPVVLAGMGQVAGGSLVSAVSNAGGLGVVGGALYSPGQLRDILQDVKVGKNHCHAFYSGALISGQSLGWTTLQPHSV